MNQLEPMQPIDKSDPDKVSETECGAEDADKSNSIDESEPDKVGKIECNAEEANNSRFIDAR